MIFSVAKDEYVLASGRTINANRGILGLAPDEGTLYDGYDGTLHEGDEPLAPAERQEIADEMIRRWQAWRNA